MQIDLLITDANVITMDEQTPRADTVAIHHGRVLAVGSADDLDGLQARQTLRLDGATVLPGFGDAHNHMAWFGQSLSEIDLSGLRSLTAVYDAVAARAGELGPEAWVVGSGYDDSALGGHPRRTELDRAAAGRPVWLKHRSGHLCTVSTEVLRLAGVIDGDVTAPEGGVIDLDADGSPSGLLEEQAQNLVVNLVVPYAVDDLSTAISHASEVYLAEGLTHVTEAGIGSSWIGKSPVELAAYQRARELGSLKVRVQLMVTVDGLHGLAGHDSDRERFGLDLGIRTGFGDSWLRLGAMKTWLDGSLIGRTAAVHEPFCDHGQSRGYFQSDPDKMQRDIVAAHVGGWQVAAHAIGDRAVDLALDSFEAAQRKQSRPEVRHRIEHAAMTSPEQIQRMARLGVTPVPQAQFVPEIGDSMAEAVGPGRADSLYRHRSFLDAGMRVPGSSDRPVAKGAPLLAMQAMVERTTANGTLLGPDERVDVQTAIRAYTVDTAWIAGEERSRGRLAPGLLADLVVLGDDIGTIDTDRISTTEVVATFLEGRCAFSTSAALQTADDTESASQ